MSTGAPPPVSQETGPTELDEAPLSRETDVLEVPWRRLNPKMLVVHPVMEVIQLIPGLIALFVAGSQAAHSELWGVAGAALVMAHGVSRWFTTTFRITPDQVQLRRGLLQRRTSTVPLDRVRTVDVTASALHRVLGLARVTVGTGQTDRRNEGLKLDALGAAEADQLAGELLHRHREVVAEESGAVAPVEPLQPAPDQVLVGWDPGWIRYGPFTLSGLVTILVVAGFAWRIVSEAQINLNRLPGVQQAEADAAAAGIALAVAVAALALAVLVLLASTIGYAVAFWGFRVTRHQEGTLQVRRGLVTRRTVTIEERRLRGVEVSEPLLLRAVGGARCIAITTGLRVGRGSERGGSMLLPPAPRRVAREVAAAVLEDGRPLRAPLTGHGPRAARRRFTRALAVAALLCVLLLAGCWRLDLPPDVWAASLLPLPVALLLAWDRARNLGHALAGGWLVVRTGSLIRRTNILRNEGVIGWNLRQSVFQRRLGLVSLSATTAAGHQRYTVQDVATPEAVRVAESAVPGLLRPFLVPENQV